MIHRIKAEETVLNTVGGVLVVLDDVPDPVHVVADPGVHAGVSGLGATHAPGHDAHLVTVAIALEQGAATVAL